MKSSSVVNGFDRIRKGNFSFFGIKKGSVIFLFILQVQHNSFTGSSMLRRAVHLIYLCCRGIARRGAHSDRRAIMVWRSLTSRPATPTSTRKDPPSNIRPSRMAAGPLRRVTRRRRTAQTSRCRLTLSSGWVDGCPTTAAAGHGSASPGSTRSTRSRSRPTSPTTRPGRKVRGGAAADAVAVTWVVHV